MAKIKLYYTGKVEGGRLVLDYPYKFKNEVGNAFDGKAVNITIEKVSRKRSNNQNAYYWGVVCALVKNGMNEFGCEYDLQETHEFLKSRFNVKEVVNSNTGEVTIIPFSTTKLSTVDFMEYIEKIQRFAADELCVVIPDPSTPTYLHIHEPGLTVHETIS